MNIDIKALEAIEADKGIGVDDLLTTIAEALLHAYYAHRGEVEDASRARVDIDAQTGTVNVMITQVDDDGNVINEFDDTPNNFGRIGAHAVRDAIVRRLREAETSRAFDAYSDFEGRVISGIVQADARAKERGIIVVHLGTEADGQDGIILPAEQIPGEKLNHGDRVKCYVVGVNRGPRNLQINLSRTHPELVRRLFELEVPEVADGAVEIVSIAREAGHRSKVAVRPTVKGLNAKGACIGPRGQRAPSKVVKVDVVDEDEQRARVVVPDYQLSLAIGKEGQNARLAARLTGWKIDIRSDVD